MAYNTAGWLLTIVLMDNGGNTTRVQYEMARSTYADVLADAVTIRTALLDVTDGVITDYYLTEKFVNDSVTYPASGVQAEVSASLTTLIKDAGGKKANIRIPMPKPSIFISTSGDGANNVNLSATPVVNYHNIFTDNQQAKLSDGEIADELLSGVRVTRAARRG